MSNRTDFDEVAAEVAAQFGLSKAAQERVENECHNAFVAGQEAEDARAAYFSKLASLALEFTYQLWTSEHEDLFPRPPHRVYWTVRLGRLALSTDGTWVYWLRASWSSEEATRALVRKQRFMTLREAIVATSKFFDDEPEHAKEARCAAKTFGESQK